MSINSIKSNPTFKGAFAYTPTGWVTISGKRVKTIPNSAIRNILEIAETKRCVYVSCDKITHPNEPAKFKNQLSKLPVILTGKTAKEYILLKSDEKNQFFNKLLNGAMELTGKVQTEQIPPKTLFKMA